MAGRLPPLDHKLLRDLWRMRGQASAIAMVIALGVLTLVMMDGLINSLDQTRQAYYERYRLADQRHDEDSRRVVGRRAYRWRSAD